MKWWQLGGDLLCVGGGIVVCSSWGSRDDGWMVECHVFVVNALIMIIVLASGNALIMIIVLAGEHQVL